MSGEGAGERILILAPVGRDAPLAAAALGQAGLATCVCSDMDDVCRELATGAGALLLTQEALPPGAAERLLATLDTQPPWSDLPIVVLLSSGEATPAIARLVGQIDDRVNATYLERPVRGTTLVGAVRGALRARRRQYELAEHLRRRVAAEESERRARAAAEEAVRVRDDFLATVAHDLKNPLGSIKGFAQLLKRQANRAGTSETDKLAQGLARIDSMATKMVAQIDELLDLARLQSGQLLFLEPQPIDLVELLRRVVAEYSSAGATDRIRLDLATPEMPGVWDPARLDRVFGNLLSNALKYSPPDTEITVRVDRVENDGEAWARVAVQDRGIGIPAADLPHLFTRFYRASNVVGRAPGSGLGLAGARQIVEQHGGTLTAMSDEGRGSIFTVSLPTYGNGMVSPFQRRPAAPLWLESPEPGRPD